MRKESCMGLHKLTKESYRGDLNNQTLKLGKFPKRGEGLAQIPAAELQSFLVFKLKGAFDLFGTIPLIHWVVLKSPLNNNTHSRDKALTWLKDSS